MITHNEYRYLITDLELLKTEAEVAPVTQAATQITPTRRLTVTTALIDINQTTLSPAFQVTQIVMSNTAVPPQQCLASPDSIIRPLGSS
ncbi:hypothetical protein SK128_003224 [Halocaridina rubra]|uniref:Uncharacterized protein n=1 Tax=Halocaridina rubra TaxID=373956 RepID=A0AAN8WZH1_HALRR